MQATTETSVLTNLADIMRLEEERKAADEARVRAAEARRVREREERERQAAELAMAEAAKETERRGQERVQQAELEKQRRGELLRIELESRARAAERRELATLEHQRELRRIELTAKRSRQARALRWALACFGVCVAMAIGFVVQVVLPTLDSAEAARLRLERTVEVQRAETAALRNELAAREEERRKRAAAAAQETATASTNAGDTPDTERPRSKSGSMPADRRNTASRDDLDLRQLDLDSNDPLSGVKR